MKVKILILAVLLPVFASAQSANFSIKGKIGNLNTPAKIYLEYMDNEVSHEDSAILVNGEFSLSGTITNSAGISSARMSLSHGGEGKAYAIYKGGDVIYPYFGNEKITITSNDSLINAQIAGSKVYNEFVAYNTIIGGTMMQLTKNANIDYASGSEEEKSEPDYAKGVDARFRENIAKRSEKQLQFAKDHPNAYFGLIALSEGAGSKVDVARVQPIYETLSPDLKATDMGKELGQRIKAVSITSVGDAAPLFTQNDMNGNPVSLADLKGKIVLIDFWASWCVPCRGENPNLAHQYRLYKDKGFQILSVSLDTDKKNWLKAINQDGMPWLHISDLKGWNNAVGRLYGVRAVPACFLIDKDGKIIANDLRGDALNAKLAEVIK
jgi:peroxiredoxin